MAGCGNVYQERGADANVVADTDTDGAVGYGRVVEDRETTGAGSRSIEIDCSFVCSSLSRRGANRDLRRPAPEGASKTPRRACPRTLVADLKQKNRRCVLSRCGGNS